MSLATNATGSLLKIGNGASTEVFSVVPGVADWSLPAPTRSFNDSTSHDVVGGFRTYQTGLLDGSEVPFKFFLDPTNVIHQQVIVDANSNPGTLRNFKGYLPTSTFNIYGWAAYITLDPIPLTVGKLIEVTGKMRVTGAITVPVA